MLVELCLHAHNLLLLVVIEGLEEGDDLLFDSVRLLIAVNHALDDRSDHGHVLDLRLIDQVLVHSSRLKASHLLEFSILFLRLGECPRDRRLLKQKIVVVDSKPKIIVLRQKRLGGDLDVDLVATVIDSNHLFFVIFLNLNILGFFGVDVALEIRRLVKSDLMGALSRLHNYVLGELLRLV